jgi:hypothetical protein
MQKSSIDKNKKLNDLLAEFRLYFLQIWLFFKIFGIKRNDSSGKFV